MRDSSADFFIQQTQETERTIVRYCLIGNQDKFDSEKYPIRLKDDHLVLAKKVTSEHSTKFYIKIGTYGKIFNPIGLYSEGKESKFLSKIGRKEFEFKEVSPKVFDMYLSFLKTKNIAWLNNAERELS
ncbi:hypothetical protein EB001_17290 [bacterium]|nr:hypothetical protein [bacterium]